VSNSGEQWGILLKWEDDGGCPQTIIMDRAMLHGETGAIAAKSESDDWARPRAGGTPPSAGFMNIVLPSPRDPVSPS
jgi:hypothetical protein